MAAQELYGDYSIYEVMDMDMSAEVVPVIRYPGTAVS